MAQTIIVDISTRGANPVAYTHQGDTGRTFFAEIYENGEAFAVAGYTIKVGAILPADRGYTVIAGNDMVTATKTNDNTTNKIYFTLSNKYSLKAGNGILTLIFTSNTGTPSTIRPINIDLRIQKSADAEDVIAGASDFPEGLEAIAESVFQEYLSTYLPPVAPSSSADANKAASAKLTGQELDNLKSDLLELQNGGYVADAQRIGEVIDDWLDEHPEATTTVQDGAITEAKFANSLKLKTIKDYVTPEMFGAVGDGLTNDTTSIQNAINYCKTNKLTLKMRCGAVYLIDSVTIDDTIQIEGSGAIIKGNSFVPMVELDSVIYNQKMWISIHNLTFDLADVAQIGLKIVNVRNGSFKNLYFCNFENENASSSNVVAGIYEITDRTESVGVGYERYFDTICFYPDISSARFNEAWASYIYCVWTNGGDDCWTNIVTHTCPHPFKMYNWSTMLANIHVVGDSGFTLTNSAGFDLDGDGPYLMDNIYIDSCPNGFKCSQSAVVIAGNVSAITVAGKISNLFYLTSASARYTLANKHIRNFYSKYNTVKLTGYSSGASMLDICAVNHDNILDLQNETSQSLTITYGNNLNGSISLVNNANGTFSIVGNIRVVDNDISIPSGQMYTLFTMPSRIRFKKNIPVYILTSNGMLQALLRCTYDSESSSYIVQMNYTSTLALPVGSRMLLDCDVTVTAN